jgi:hypothetical protein
MDRAFCRRVPSRFSSLPMNKRLRRVVSCGMSASRCLAILALLFVPLLQAAPAWQKELTSPDPGTFSRPVPTVLDFQLSWKGAIDSGKVRIEFAPPDVKKPGTYVVRSSSASLGAAAVLFPYQNHFWSELDPVSFRPRFFHAVETDKKESVTTTVRHFSGRVESREITSITKTGKTKQTDKVFAFAPVFDVFSAMLHVRSQKLDNGDKLVIPLQPFNKPYLMRVTVLGRERFANRDTIKLSVALEKIDPKTKTLLPYKKMKSSTLWLSDDANRIPVELRSEVFIGDVRMTLAGARKL